MDAPALRAPGGSVVEAAREVSKPRTWHAAAEGFAVIHAGPPVWDCVVGHESPGEAASRDESPGPETGRRSDAAMRGCCGTSLKGCESAGRARSRLRLRVRSGRCRPAGRFERRTGGAEPMTALHFPDPCPRSAARPHERQHGSPRGGSRHPRQPSLLWRALSTKVVDSLVRVC
jgi:hypothetical protein